MWVLSAHSIEYIVIPWENVLNHTGQRDTLGLIIIFVARSIIITFICIAIKKGRKIIHKLRKKLNSPFTFKVNVVKFLARLCFFK